MSYELTDAPGSERRTPRMPRRGVPLPPCASFKRPPGDPKTTGRSPCLVLSCPVESGQTWSSPAVAGQAWSRHALSCPVEPGRVVSSTAAAPGLEPAVSRVRSAWSRETSNPGHAARVRSSRGIASCLVLSGRIASSLVSSCPFESRSAPTPPRKQRCGLRVLGCRVLSCRAQSCRIRSRLISSGPV